MNGKTILKLIIKQYLICFFLTMMATVFFTSVSTPRITGIRVSLIWQLALFSFLAVALDIIYYSKSTLSSRQMLVRDILHTIALVFVLMAAGKFLGLYEGICGALLFAGTVLVVDILVRVATFLMDRLEVREINAALDRKEKRHEGD